MTETSELPPLAIPMPVAPKLCIKHPEAPEAMRTIKAWLDGAAWNSLEAVRRDYASLIGRPVSTSLIVRRSLALLADHLRSIEASTQAQPAQATAERATLVTHLR